MARVAIVGAGPAGASLALLLAQRGIAVTQIEAARDYQRQFRGEGLMPSGLAALHQMGLKDRVASVPQRPLAAWEFWLDDRRLFQAREPMGAVRPCTLISQPGLLAALAEAAAGEPSFESIGGTAVKDVRWRQGRVVGIGLADGRTVEADLVIGADGRASTVRQRAGIPLETQPQSLDVLWFKLPAPPGDGEDNRFCTVVKGGRVFSFFHGAEAGQLHLAWALPPSEPTPPQDWAATLAALVPPPWVSHFQAVGEAISAPVRLSVLVGRAPRWHCPGLLLLGDAAHPMSPVRAQGINMALRDAIVAANHLVPVLRTEAVDPGLLDGAIAHIQAEREPEIVAAQRLQAHEASRGELLRTLALLRQGLSRMAPVAGPVVRQIWIRQQRPLREGIAAVRLTV